MADVNRALSAQGFKELRESAPRSTNGLVGGRGRGPKPDASLPAARAKCVVVGERVKHWDELRFMLGTRVWVALTNENLKPCGI